MGEHAGQTVDGVKLDLPPDPGAPPPPALRTFADVYGLEQLDADRKRKLVSLAVLPGWPGGPPETGHGLGRDLNFLLGGGIHPGWRPAAYGLGMDPYALALLAVALGGLSWLSVSAWSRARRRAIEPPLRAFSSLLVGDLDGAIAILTRVAATGNPEAYFALGTLFRQRGELDRALQLHRNLLLAPHLAPGQGSRLHLELARDLRQAGQLDEARVALANAAAAAGSPTERRAVEEELAELQRFGPRGDDAPVEPPELAGQTGPVR